MTVKITAFIIAISAIAGEAAAQIYMMERSYVKFFSHALIEDITAENTQAQGLINFADKSFSFKVPIPGFQFAKDLMKEHFNENYMESEKYPHGTFKGTFSGEFDLSKNGTYQLAAEGTLYIHGVENRRTIPSLLIVEGKNIRLESLFMVKLADYKIKIPQIVFQNIAEEVEVTVKSNLVPYKK